HPGEDFGLVWGGHGQAVGENLAWVRLPQQACDGLDGLGFRQVNYAMAPIVGAFLSEKGNGGLADERAGRRSNLSFGRQRQDVGAPITPLASPWRLEGSQLLAADVGVE